jgi:hypothetical protein
VNHNNITVPGGAGGLAQAQLTGQSVSEHTRRMLYEASAALVPAV